MDDLSTQFATLFGQAPEATAFAPARVNLIGEHVDYNDGPVLPAALALTTRVALARSSDAGLDAYSTQFDRRLMRPMDTPRCGDWLDYVAGCVGILGEQAELPPGLKILIDSTIPMGAGISSSAALELSVLKALNELLDLSLSAPDLARLGQRVENDFIGMQCGLMDQMACAIAVPGVALYFDTQSGETEDIPLLPGHTFAVVHSGVEHRLIDGGYNQRRSECETAAKSLGVTSLRTLSPADLPRIEALDSPFAERARHIVTEIDRVIRARTVLRDGNAVAFGALMTQSHASQRDDYLVSLPEIDALVDTALSHGALGARLTGGGFGGSIVALVETSALEGWRDNVLAEQPQAHWVSAT
ncbi:MAG: galactokinase [Pseudomonadota bacterium]